MDCRVKPGNDELRFHHSRRIHPKPSALW